MASELKEKAAKGLLWGALSNGSMQLLNLIFGVVLARLLTPADYGMVGMLSIFSLIASSLQESGFTAALANRPKIEHRDYNAVFWFSSAVSITIYILLFIAAPWIAKFYGDPALTPLARYSFLSFVISSFGTAHSAYLFRSLMVKQRTISMVVALSISGIVGITMAYQGYSYWSIATQTLVYIACTTIGFWYFSPWRPTFRPDMRPLGDMLRFSVKLLLTNIVNNVNNNLFSVILGRFYSAREVGNYNQGNKWNGMCVQLINGMVSGIAQPTFNQAGNEEQRQQRVFRKMLRFTAMVSFPCMFGLAFVAPELITVALGVKWMDSAMLLRILAMGGAFWPITTLYSNFIVARGHSSVILYNTLALTTTQLIVAMLLIPYGIATMVMVYCTVNVVWLLVWQYFLQREIHLGVMTVLRDMTPYLTVAATAIVLSHFATVAIHNTVLLLIAKVVITALLYVGILWLAGSIMLREAVGYILHRKK